MCSRDLIGIRKQIKSGLEYLGLKAQELVDDDLGDVLGTEKVIEKRRRIDPAPIVDEEE